MKFSFHDLSSFKRIRNPLNATDLEFFYYCIANESSSIMLNSVDWYTDVEPIIITANVAIRFSDTTINQTDSNDGFVDFPQNTIVLKEGDQNESEVSCLFRHLRNAFSHFRINRVGEEYLMCDMSGDTMTMKARINAEKIQSIIVHILQLVDERIYNSQQYETC